MYKRQALRIAWQVHAGTLSYRLRSSGITPDTLPDDLEDTLNPKKT